ncbi:MAG: MerR family transcriptional regulator [Labilithrix sp.]|nr:MerR family transcriptional regulator [Labilithrix sp.]
MSGRSSQGEPSAVARELPSKLFFRIGEVAGLVGVEPHVLRYWEREFRSIRPTKSAKGQRVYSRRDVENLLRVRDLLYRDGFTIAGAKKRLARGPTAEAGSAEGSDVDEASAVPASGVEMAVEMAVESEPDGSEGWGPHDPEPSVREKLTALRSEVEAFLAELEPPVG